MDIQVSAPVDQRGVELMPESVLPCQLGDGLFGMARLQPEKRLQLAVLEDAILSFHRLAGVNGARFRRLFAETKDWFASEETNGPFTFVTICDTLNLDPNYIRGGLNQWRARIDVVVRTPPFRREGVETRHRVVGRALGQVA